MEDNEKVRYRRVRIVEHKKASLPSPFIASRHSGGLFQGSGMFVGRSRPHLPKQSFEAPKREPVKKQRGLRFAFGRPK